MTNRAIDERVFPRHTDVVRAAVAKAISKMGWEAKNAGDGIISAVSTSPFLKLKDDITIVVAPGDRGGTKLRVRSLPRGRFDFGRNAKHIQDLFAEVQKAL